MSRATYRKLARRLRCHDGDDAHAAGRNRLRNRDGRLIRYNRRFSSGRRLSARSFIHLTYMSRLAGPVVLDRGFAPALLMKL